MVGKIGIQKNKIGSMHHLMKKLKERSDRNLVLFLSYTDKCNVEFTKFVMASRTLLSVQDAEFAFAYVEDFGKDIGNLKGLMQTTEFRKHQCGVRVYRRGNIGDYRDF